MNKTYLMIQHLQIHNANAMSTPYTIGFPAMTAWLGAMHALERKLHQQGMNNIIFTGVAVSSHQCDVQIYRGQHDYCNLIIDTANPLKKSKKTGEFERPPFIEEARCHLDVTLLIEVIGEKPNEDEVFLQTVRKGLSCMKIASGDIVSNIVIDSKRKRQPADKNIEAVNIVSDVTKTKLLLLSSDGEGGKNDQRIISRLMPGYVLLERRDLMQLERNQDALDALLRGLQVNLTAEKDENGKVIRWQAEKEIQDGWLVPIAVGFKDLSGTMQVKNQRDENYEHHFVEPLVTLGEFVMPYHYLYSVNNMLWRYHYDADQGLYLCKNDENEEED